MIYMLFTACNIWTAIGISFTYVLNSAFEGIEMCDKNNLELYLNDVFEKECVFKSEQKEVEFIQNGIENLAQRIVDLVLDDLSRNKTKWKGSTAYMTLLRNSEIIKVGSYYEGTKNKFPDEFDIIFCFYEQKGDALFSYAPVTEVIKQVCKKHKHALRYTDTRCAKQKIDFEKYVEKHGPATWLRFIYRNRRGEKKYINVDLVPASRFFITEREHLVTVTEICTLVPFRPEILSTGSFLIVEDNFSFTETEVHFMRNVLSRNHVKVYRILKQLINGHSAETVYKDGSMSCYTSYVIKSIMIEHHYRCKRSVTADILVGPCLLQVLDTLGSFEYDTQVPKLVARRIRGPSIVPECYLKLFLRSYLQSMTTTLRSMQNSRSGYDYERDRITKSLLEQYLDENGEPEMQIDFCTLL